MPMSYFYYVSFRERRALAVWHLYATYFHHDKFLPYYVSIILRARRKMNFVFAIMCNFFATWKMWALIIFLSCIVYANISFGCKRFTWRNKWHILFDNLSLQKNTSINKNICDCISLVRTDSLFNHTMQFECCKRKLA